jgi:putative ABC transport system ATP-binding protein
VDQAVKADNESGSRRIELLNVSKRYTNRDVLRDFSLVIADGEFVVFVGRSGSGKSTLLKIVGGLEQPTTGAVIHAGQDITRMSEQDRALFRRRSLGFVFQFFNLIPTLSVAENIGLPLAMNGVRGREADRRTCDLSDELGLSDCATRFPEELSGGEQQRVAIARALANEPRLVIADEPTGNLDLETASTVLSLLNESCRRRGTTLIMATHSNEVVGMADRVLGLRDGEARPIN